MHLNLSHTILILTESDGHTNILSETKDRLAGILNVYQMMTIVTPAPSHVCICDYKHLRLKHAVLTTHLSYRRYLSMTIFLLDYISKLQKQINKLRNLSETIA